MKRWIIWIGIAVLLVLGYVWLSKQKIHLSALEGEIVRAERGDLVIPVNASGLIEPALRVEIKSKASGEVSKIYVEEGDLVRKGQLLLELDPVDENRNVERAQAEADRAYATLRKAQINLWKQIVDYPVQLALASANVEAAEARHARLKWEFEKTEQVYKRGSGSDLEYRTSKAAYEEAAANVERAWADLEAAYNRRALIESAREDVELAEAAYEAAVKTLEEAQERLKETKVYAPIHGMVVKINTRVGEVIQSGETSLTGGTVLMELADVSQLYVVAQVDEADIGTVLELAPVSARPGPQRAAARMARPVTASAARADVDPQNGSTARPASATQPAELAPLPRGVGEGTPVRITVEAFRDEDFQGMIERILPEPLRKQSVVTYDVRIRLASPNRYKLLLGMQADVEFTAESIRNAILVPVDAVKRGPDGQLGVYVPPPAGEPLGEPQFRRCRFGLEDGIRIEVIEGLKEGEKVYKRLPKFTRKQLEERRKQQEQED